MHKTGHETYGTMVVHGGGYVGLTAAVHFAMSAWWDRVVIYDPDPRVCRRVLEGNPRGNEFLSYLDTQVKDLVDRKRLLTTTNVQAVVGEHYHTIAVPTEKEGQPYGDIVNECLKNLFAYVPNDSLIIIDSTLQPGMIDKVLAERPNDVHVAVCPRRDWFASKEMNISNLQRVIGGIDDLSTEMARTILGTITRPDLLLTTDYQTAEITKALENAFLHIPVMFAHQMALAFPDKNVREAVRLAGTHWRLPQYFIGFGTGGRCVPLGTKYLQKAAEEAMIAQHHFINKLTIGREALKAEDQIRSAIGYFVMEYLHKQGQILILGAGYRPDFQDIGGSPGIDIGNIITWWTTEREVNCGVVLHDPLWSERALHKATGLPTTETLKVYSDWTLWDAILLATPHSAYQLIPEGVKMKPGQLVLDANGAWEGYRQVFKDQKVDYRVVGDPNWRKLSGRK